MMQIFALVLSVLVLTSCSSKSSTSSTSQPASSEGNPSTETIVPGVTECDNPDEISPDGKYVCAGHGAFYWLLLSDVGGSAGDGQNSNSSSGNEPAITTITLPSFVGYTQADVDAWKRQNALQIQVHYSTAMGYNYTVSCQMQGRGVVLKQNPMPGTQVEDSLGTVIWLDLDC